MLTVQFEDHSEAIKERLRRKLAAATFAAADQLSDGYKDALQETIAPPHSQPGEIPHAYHGWKPGGFGPTNPGFQFDNPDTWFNNRPPGFLHVQGSYLSNFIESGGSSGGAVVGFRASHVGSRRQNYLIGWDQGWYGHVRPWVLPVYRQERAIMISKAAAAFERA